jgi:hypothetical protein
MSEVPSRVVITDIDISVWRMTVFFLKVSIAFLPIGVVLVGFILLIDLMAADLLSKILLP